jgi:hypothetical protein
MFAAAATSQEGHELDIVEPVISPVADTSFEEQQQVIKEAFRHVDYLPPYLDPSLPAAA